MSAEEQAINLIQDINGIITETLEDLRNSRKDSRQLNPEELKQFSLIQNKLKEIQTNLKEYTEGFRVQTKLTDY
jgi:hypothetical protein